MSGDIFLVCGVGVLCVIAASCVRAMKPEIANVMRLAFCVLLGGMLVGRMIPITRQLRGMMDSAAAEYSEVLLKALGVALLTHLTAELCRDCGESSVASGVETLGKLEILTLCMPLVSTALDMVRGILSW